MLLTEKVAEANHRFVPYRASAIAEPHEVVGRSMVGRHSMLAIHSSAITDLSNRAAIGAVSANPRRLRYEVRPNGAITAYSNGNPSWQSGFRWD